MSGSAEPAVGDVLRRAALRAIRAPSIHNTQPWSFVLTGDSLEIRADRSRQLDVLDPRGRQLMISCGCALLHARVAIESQHRQALVTRFPDEHHPDLLASVRVGAPRDYPESDALERAIDDRRTNRRVFGLEPVPHSIVTELQHVAQCEDAVLHRVEAPGQRAALLRLNALADRLERGDPAYLDEIRRWTTDDPRRPDGVQAASIPFVGPDHDGASGMSIRGFDVRGMGWLPSIESAANADCLLLLCTRQDDALGWLRGGEALERVWLTLTGHGYWASPLTQLIEVRSTHEQLRLELRVTEHPAVLLRVGHAPQVVQTRRRDPADVITESG